MEKKPKKPISKILKLFILLFVIALVVVVLFYVFNPKKALKLVFPDLDKISNINAVIKNDSAFTKFSLILENKNPYKLDIDTLAFEVKLSDTVIARQIIPVNIRQTRFDIDTIKVPLNLNIKKIRGLIKSLQGQDSTDIKIKGYIIYQTIFGRAKIDINKKTKIQVPVPPEIKILKVERKSFNLKEKTLKANASVEIINKGKIIDLQLTNIHYDMLVKNTLHSNGVISKPITIKPKSSMVVNIPIEIKVFHPLKTAWLITIDKDQVNYVLHVTCNIKENMSDKAFSSPAEVVATGTLELVK